MTVRLVWRTDVHLADKAPQARLDDWVDTVSDKLAQVGDIARRVGAQAVIDGGDFFHVKSPGRNSHHLVRKTIEIHEDYPCPVYACVGNHDCVYGDYAKLPQQPLGVLYEAGVFRRLYDEHEAVFEVDGVKVRVVGIPYHGTTYDMQRFDIKKGDEDYLVVAAHVLASEGGGSMFEGEDIVRYSDLYDLDPDVWVFGHWHKDQGITKAESRDGRPRLIVNVGSLTRGSLSEDQVDRKPAAVALIFNHDEVQHVRFDLEVASKEEVFDIASRVRHETRSMALDGFVKKMKESLNKTSKTPLEDQVRALPGVPPAVKEKALHYLEMAG